MKITSKPPASARRITFTNETTAEESTPVTRRRSITRKRGGVSSSIRCRIRSSRRFVDPKNTNPLTRRIWTRCGEPAELGALLGRAIDVAAIRLAEGDLADQLDPAVADDEEHDREHQADHHPGQEPPDDDPHEDHEHHGVLAPGQRSPLVPDPLDDEGEPEEHQHAPDDHLRDQRHDRAAEHDGGQRDERRDEPAALASTRMRSASAVRESA